MMIDRQLLERIDACRSGSEDLQDPGLAPLASELQDADARALYDRVQAIDRIIGEAAHDVPLPAGLSERLLAHLAATQVVTAADQPAPSPTADTTPVVSRRSWLRWGAGLTVAASIAVVAISAYLWRTAPLTAQGVKEQILPFYNQEQRRTGNRLNTVPAGYPLSRHLNQLPGTTWRQVESFLNRPELAGVAYDLMYGGSEATLYVVRTQIAGLPNSPPPKIGAVTGNLAPAVWQEGPILYVLVVQGGERAYQSFVKRQPIG